MKIGSKLPEGGSGMNLPVSGDPPGSAPMAVGGGSTGEGTGAVPPSAPQDAFGGRIQMFCPTNARASVARLTQRNKNKH